MLDMDSGFCLSNIFEYLTTATLTSYHRCRRCRRCHRRRLLARYINSFCSQQRYIPESVITVYSFIAAKTD